MAGRRGLRAAAGRACSRTASTCSPRSRRRAAGPALAFNSHIDTWMHRDDHLIWRDPGQPDFHVGREEGDMLDRQPGGQRQGADGGVAARGEGDPRRRRDARRAALPDRGAGRDRPGAGGRVPGQAVPEQGGRRALPGQPHARARASALCAEATGFRKGWIEAGKAFYKITVYGGPVLYTPYVARPVPARRAPQRDRARAAAHRAPRGVGARVRAAPHLRVAGRHRGAARQRRRRSAAGSRG